MDLVILVVVLVLLGFLVWLLTTKVPMPPGWATAIQVGALILVVLWILTKVVKLPNFMS